jgi:DNA modification methylase
MSEKNKGQGGALAYIAEQLRPLAIAIDSVHPDTANARKHNEKNMDAIVASLHRFGQRAPIVVQKSGMIVRAGNGRLAAAKSLGWSHIAALIVDDSSVDATAYAIADNRTAELAEWDTETLAALLNSLDDEDLKVTGYDQAELDQMLAELAPMEVTQDEVPEAPINPITKTGDLWLLGDHRLLCGDSTKAEDVERLMAGAKADMMVTDPPYNVEYEGNYIQSGRILKKEQKVWSGGIANDNLDNFGEWLACVFAASDAAIEIGAAIYIWHPPGEDGKYFWAAWPYDEWHFQVDLVWNKKSLIISRWDYKPQHEPCMYGWKGKNRSWIGPNNEPTVWDIPRQQGASGEKRDHPTQKPVECMARAIRNHDGSVYDPFLGSGTTLIAAEQLGRKCYGMEISPQYCDVIVKRWEASTGKKATCEGKTIDELAKERGIVR